MKIVSAEAKGTVHSKVMKIVSAEAKGTVHSKKAVRRSASGSCSRS